MDEIKENVTRQWIAMPKGFFANCFEKWFILKYFEDIKAPLP